MTTPTIRRQFFRDNGFRYYKDDTSILLRALALTKDGLEFTDEQKEKFGGRITEYVNSINQFGYLPKDNSKLNNDVSVSQENIIYKYISKDTYERFISKGNFQFGNIEYYQETENKKIKDLQEGFTTLFIKTSNRHLVASAMTGFNYYIFCGTANCNKDKLMTDRFGDYLLKINNPDSFATAVKKAIGAKNYYIDKIKYVSTKYHSVAKEINIDGLHPDNISTELFDTIQKEALFPSIFSKPDYFVDENEIRLIFKMPKDTKRPLRINNRGLLDYIEIIK